MFWDEPEKVRARPPDSPQGLRLGLPPHGWVTALRQTRAPRARVKDKNITSGNHEPEHDVQFIYIILEQFLRKLCEEKKYKSNILVAASNSDFVTYFRIIVQKHTLWMYIFSVSHHNHNKIIKQFICNVLCLQGY